MSSAEVIKAKGVARQLLIAGQTDRELVAKTAGLPLKTVDYIAQWLSSPGGQAWLVQEHPESKLIRGGPKTVQTPPPPPPQTPPQNPPSVETKLPPPRTEPNVATTLRPGQVLVDPETGKRLFLVSDDGEGGTVLERPVEGVTSEGESVLVVRNPVTPGKNPLTVQITPWTLIWFQVSNGEALDRFGKEYEGGMPQFIEDCIKGYMKMKGRKFAYVSEVGD